MLALSEEGKKGVSMRVSLREAAHKEEWGLAGGDGKVVSFTCEIGITGAPSSGLSIRSDQT